MKRAVQLTQVNQTFIRDVGDPTKIVPLPPEKWFVRGPRGGLYIAIGERERFTAETGDDFIRNTISVVDRSEGTRYVRPGSRLAREAETI